MSDAMMNLKNLGHEVTSDEKVLGAIAYFFLFFLIPLLGKRSSAFVQYHAKQGMLLFFSWFGLLFLGMIPVIGWLVVIPFGTLGLIILSVIGFINALSGHTRPVPFIGKYATRIHI
ncbi:MAG: hypothetical protein ACPGO5_03090 [Patescibacteria group bacterium]